MRSTKIKQFKIFFTSGKLHKMPQVRNSLELICGNVAVIGDLTSPSQGKTTQNFISKPTLTSIFIFIKHNPTY